ncbi:hypothetical protein [Curtobacterium sp. Leaf261]|uniref:hypothetical protein n=1 Tax=Curtobacterium sp. Leaf261 TaxID=1736311 RepID=UPI0006F53EEE|nr:hypothetical protein [Curtobacterium sp. Leaf261]KQO61304.1 hypothetical protein ASF23_12495 [Curtobacterium sp. Leaf261]
MSDQEQGQPDEPEQERLQRVQEEAARLGLAVIAEATAMSSGDLAMVEASEANLKDTVDTLVDEPLTERQEEVFETLGAMGGSITAGLGSALAHAQGREPEAVLSGAAASIVWQQRLATGELADGTLADAERDRREDDDR